MATSNSSAMQASLLQAYARDGYLVLRAAIDPTRLGEWVDEVEAMEERPGRQMVYYEGSVTDPAGRLRARIENFVPWHDGLRALVVDGLQAAASAVLGEEAVLFKDKIILKKPGSSGMAAHQDVQAGWLDYASRFVNAMVAVDAATSGNGCLEMVAGAHRRGLLGDVWKPLDEERISELTFVPLPCQPGDVVLFDGLAPHRSGENRSETSRRALYLTWSPASEGDARARYYADKRASFPPDCERESGQTYVYRV
jgi:ectoine hydroxylase-related dioxygenase (phytanoyl-CoA dioxygenase family)